MSDVTLNKFLRTGTNAERLAFTPNPAADDAGYFFHETDTGDSYAWNGTDWVLVGGPASGGGGGGGGTPGASQTTFLVSGGQVVWISDYIFRVSAATYYIQGTQYQSPETEITLDAADATDDRIDILAVDDNGAVVKITGTPAAQPSEPDVDPATQLKLAIILVQANTTEPATATNELLYAENAGSAAEWDWASSDASLVSNSTAQPRTGTINLEGTNVVTNAYLEATRGSGTIDPTDYEYLVLYLRSKAQWSNNRGLAISLRLAGVLQSAVVQIRRSGTYGFASNNTSTYQQVAIPMVDFAVAPGTVIDQVRIANFGGAIGFYADDVFFQIPAATPSAGSGLTQDEADARYRQLSVPLVLSSAADVSGDLPLANLTPATGASKLLGRGDSGAGDLQELTLGAGLAMTGTTLSASGTGDVAGPASAVDDRIAVYDGTSGKLIKDGGSTIADVVAAGAAAAAAAILPIDLAADVTGDLPLSNLAQASAASKLLGRGSAAGAGDFQEVTLGTGLSMSGTTLDAAAGGGSNSSTGAVGSEPGASAGHLYFPDNGFSLERYSGSAWVPWGPLFPMTAPVDGDFAWVNQGGAAVSTTNGGIFLSAPLNSPGDNLRIRKKSAPSTPYTITVAFLPLFPNVNFIQMGLCFRQSSDGKLHTFHIFTNSGVGAGLLIGSWKWTNPTTFSAGYTMTATLTSHNTMGNGLIWLRIGDNGTNRTCEISGDGQNWLTVHSVGRTDFLTADEVGFFANVLNASYGVGLTLVSWKQA